MSELRVSRSNIRFGKMNAKVAKIVSETGAELFAKSTRNCKGSLDDANFVFEVAEKASGGGIPPSIIAPYLNYIRFK